MQVAPSVRGLLQACSCRSRQNAWSASALPASFTISGIAKFIIVLRGGCFSAECGIVAGFRIMPAIAKYDADSDEQPRFALSHDGFSLMRSVYRSAISRLFSLTSAHSMMVLGFFERPTISTAYRMASARCVNRRYFVIDACRPLLVATNNSAEQSMSEPASNLVMLSQPG